MSAKETCYVYRRPPVDLTRGRTRGQAAP